MKIHKIIKIRGVILISPFLYVEETAPERIKKDSVHKSIWGFKTKDSEKASVSQYIDGDNENFISILAKRMKTGEKNKIKDSLKN